MAGNFETKIARPSGADNNGYYYQFLIQIVHMFMIPLSKNAVKGNEKWKDKIVWCPGRDSNPHDLRREILSLLWLPVTPPGHFFFFDFFLCVLVVSYGNSDKEFVNFLICYQNALH